MTEKIIVLGEHRIPVASQPWPRLKHKIPQVLSTEDMRALEDGDISGQLDVIGEKGWRLLCILAPNVEAAVPLHVWQGFDSPEAMELGEYDDEAAGRAPTMDQIVVALETAINVNGAARFGGILGLVNDTAAQLGGGGGAPPASGRQVTPT